MMKILIVLAILLSAQRVAAQTDTLVVSIQDKEQAFLRKMTDLYGIDDDQYSQIQDRLVSRRNEMLAIQADESTSTEQKRILMKAVASDFREGLSAVLSDQQFDEFMSQRNALDAARKDAGVSMDSLEEIEGDF